MMNSTPKYSNNIRHSVSPLRSSNKQRYYSAEEVNRIVRASFQPKIKYLIDELEARQQAIGRLNNQLNANDQKLIQQTQIIDSYSHQQKNHHQAYSQLPSIVSQVLNQKIKQFGNGVARQLNNIAVIVQDKYDPRQLQQRIIGEI